MAKALNRHFPTGLLRTANTHKKKPALLASETCRQNRREPASGCPQKTRCTRDMRAQSRSAAGAGCRGGLHGWGWGLLGQFI